MRSGLGVPVSGDDGVPLSPDEFGNLLHRIARGQATDADKNVFVSRKPHLRGYRPGFEFGGYGLDREVVGSQTRGLLLRKAEVEELEALVPGGDGAGFAFETIGEFSLAGLGERAISSPRR